MSNPYQGYTETTATTVTTATPEPIGQRRVRWSRCVAGAYAGVFALSLAVFAVAGVVWGLLRPTYTAYVEDPETASVEVSPNVEFTAFIWFAIMTGIIGAILALIIFLRVERARGLGMLLWIGAVTLIGAAVFLVFGNFSAGVVNPRPTDYTQVVGETFQFVPSMLPGSALFAAPFLAVLMYWCATFVSPTED